MDQLHAINRDLLSRLAEAQQTRDHSQVWLACLFCLLVLLACLSFLLVGLYVSMADGGCLQLQLELANQRQASMQKEGSQIKQEYSIQVRLDSWMHARHG